MHCILYFQNQTVRKAYESLMVVSLLKPTNVQFKMFETKVKERSLQLYNFSFDALQYDVSMLTTMEKEIFQNGFMHYTYIFIEIAVG